MSGETPGFNIQSFEYRGDQESWDRIIGLAKFVVEQAGTLVVDGSVEVEWESRELGKHFKLQRRELDGTEHYWLKFPDRGWPVDSVRAPMMTFQADTTHVTGFFGGAIELYSGYTSAEEKFEHAEIDLASFLATHRAVYG